MPGRIPVLGHRKRQRTAALQDAVAYQGDPRIARSVLECSPQRGHLSYCAGSCPLALWTRTLCPAAPYLLTRTVESPSFGRNSRQIMWHKNPSVIVFALAALAAATVCRARQATTKTTDTDSSATTNWTAEQDHRNMMEQLGIKSLRRGADGNNRQATNYQNTDEAKANPFPNLPDPLTLKNGDKGHDAGNVVEATPPGNRGGFRPGNLWPGSRTCRK